MTTDALAGLYILLLEDEFLIAMDVEQICKEHGAASVVIKREVGELSDEIWNEDFDVALIDLMLAGHSTTPFARTLQDRKVPFVFASGYSDIDGLRAEFPGVGFIGKPYSETALVEAIFAAVRPE